MSSVKEQERIGLLTAANGRAPQPPCHSGCQTHPHHITLKGGRPVASVGIISKNNLLL